MMRPAWSLLVVLVGFALAGCASAAAPSGPARAAVPTLGPAPTSHPEGMFDVGGYSLFLKCTGPVDGPVVVYLHGMEGSHRSAQGIPDGLVDHIRWCAYDRANAGMSDRVEEKRLGSAFAEELHTLLEVAGIDGPYVLVGASHGGLIAVLFAELFPDDVAGMVLLDGGAPNLREIYALIPEEDRAAEIAASEANPEKVEFFATVDEAKAMLDQLPDVPVTFMLAVPALAEEPSTWPIDEIRALDAKAASDLVARFREGRLVKVVSPHYMEGEVPGEIRAEIERVVGLVQQAAG